MKDLVRRHTTLNEVFLDTFISPSTVHTGDTCILGRQPSHEYQTELTSKSPLLLLTEILSDV